MCSLSVTLSMRRYGCSSYIVSNAMASFFIISGRLTQNPNPMNILGTWSVCLVSVVSIEYRMKWTVCHALPSLKRYYAYIFGVWNEWGLQILLLLGLPRIGSIYAI